MVTLAEALDAGRREALQALADRLAAEIDGCATARDRLPTVRAFLATVTALETLDAAEARRAQATPATAGHGPVEAPGGGVDDLLARRRARRGVR